MAELAPIRREIVVAGDPATAFAVFTEQIGSWWPLGDLSVHGAGAAVSFTGGTIVESKPGEPDAIWGRVLAWEPPRRIAFTWHPGQPIEPGSDTPVSRVTVTFVPAGAGTLVRLEHAGWESFADPDAARAEYDHGWPLVLEEYRRAAGADEDGNGRAATWVALVHRPVRADRPVFDDPLFAEHVAFLQRMHAAGCLIAAGPLPDEPGSGMTILRLPGPDRIGDATRLATTDDRSVAEGLFSVAVRPWDVMLHQ
jgi:uncharacterized protein YndB with AHSA1/START domain/uncharacterized protein YciI